MTHDDRSHAAPTLDPAAVFAQIVEQLRGDLGMPTLSMEGRLVQPRELMRQAQSNRQEDAAE